MDVKEFFRKTKEICDRNYYTDCLECPLTNYCLDGIFSATEEKVDEIIAAVENALNI